MRGIELQKPCDYNHFMGFPVKKNTSRFLSVGMRLAFLTALVLSSPVSGNVNEDLRKEVAAGDAKAVTKLIDQGASANQKAPGGRTLLMFAAQEGFDEVVVALIKGSAFINEQDSVGQTALMYAAEYGHLAVVRVLVLARADLTLKSLGGMTAMELAEKAKHFEVAALLKKAMARKS